MRRLALLTTVALSACAVPSQPEEVGRAASPVINGEVDTPARYNSTILIETQISASSGAGCTGTLVSPHVVVTARHCVSDFNESTRLFGADFKPENMRIWYGTEPRGSADNDVARIVHPPGTSIENNDIALLVLKKKATIDFAPIRLAAAPKTGELVSVAGYGLTTMDTGSPTELHKRYRRENLKIIAVGPVPSYGIGAKEIVLGESICQGDSGGPVYAQGSVALLAVTSRGGNGKNPTAAQPYLGCTGTNAFNLFTRVDSFADLIKKTVAEAGETVWEEGTPKPTAPTTPVPDPGALGSACGGPDDCASKLCIAWDGAQVCSQACDDAKPCPADFACTGGYCLKGTTTDPVPDPSAGGTTGAPVTPKAEDTGSSGSCAVGPVGTRGSSLALVGLGALALVAARARRKVA